MKSRILAFCCLFGTVLVQAQDTGKSAVIDPPKATTTEAVETTVKDLQFPENVIFPEHAFAPAGSPVLAYGGRQGFNDTTITVLSLKTGSPIGKVTTKEITKVAVSPDGHWLAGFAGLGKTDSATVYDVTKNQLLRTIDFDKQTDQLFFIGADRLAAVHKFKQQIQVYDITTGKRTAQIDTDANAFEMAFAVSPGGQWLVTFKKETAIAHSLSGGEPVTLFDLEKVRTITPRPKGAAFSLDGKSLGVVYDSIGKPQLSIFNLETGKLAKAVELPAKQNFGFQGTVIEPTGDGKGWLINGETVADRDTGAKLWTVPSDSTGTVARAPVINQVFAIDARNKKTPVKLSTLNKNNVGAMAEVAKAGGDPRDVLRGKLLPANLAAAKTVELAASSPWINPLPDPANSTITSDFSTKVPANEIGNFVFGETSLAFEQIKPNALPTERGALGATVLHGVSGAVLGTLKFAVPSELRDLSPDGQAVLILDAGKPERLDVIATRDGKSIAAWRPYESKPDGDRTVVYAAFLDGKRVLTVSNRGTLAVWTIADAKATAVLDTPVLKVGRLTPNRKHYVACTGESLRILDATTLESKGVSEAGEPGTPIALAFKADGREMAGLYQVGGIGEFSIRRWDTDKGKHLSNVKTKHALGNPMGNAVRLQYAGDFFLVDDRMLVNPATREIDWMYVRPGFHQQSAINPPDERVWYAAGTVFNQPAKVLASILPDAATATMLAEVKDAKDPILPPGSKLKLKYDAKGNYADKVRDKVDTSVKKLIGQHTLADNGDYDLIVELAEEDLNKTETFRVIGEFKNVQVKMFAVNGTVRLEKAGDVIWKGNPIKYGMDAHFTRIPAEERDLGEFLRRRMWENVAAGLTGAMLPRLIVRTPSGLAALPGLTTLTSTGPKTVSPSLR